MLGKRSILAGFAAVLVAGLASGATLAHHGWRWAMDENFEITGTVKTVRLGNPHGIVTIEADGQEWRVEVGQPWRNARAGLEDDMLTEGVVLTASGHRSADPSERVVKAERVIIDGKTYELYPDRD